MRYLLNKIFFVLILIIPVAVNAELSSTNYSVVEHHLGGQSFSANGTSTNYDGDLEAGGLYIYDVSTSTPTPSGGSSSGGGSKKTVDPIYVSDSILIGPLTVVSGQIVTVVLQVKDAKGDSVHVDPSLITIRVSGTTNTSLSIQDLGNGIYQTSYISSGVGVDKISAVVDGNLVTKDTDGLSDGTLTVSVTKPRATPQASNGPENSNPVPPTQPAITTPEVPALQPAPTSLTLEYGITNACNRAFAWGRSISATVYRTIGDGEPVLLGTVPASMPWFVDYSRQVDRNLSYNFRFSDGSTKEISFTSANFENCREDDSVVTQLNVDSDTQPETLVEGIFLDLDGQTVPLAVSLDGVALDTDGDNQIDTFWNPLVGTSPVIVAGDRLFIIDSKVAPHQSYLPLASGFYRVKVEPLENGNVALVSDGAKLIEFEEIVEELPVVPETAALNLSLLFFLNALVTTLLALGRTPVSVTHLLRTITHTAHNLVALLVFWRKRKPWGVVYDSATKVPIDPAIVELFDTNNVKVDQAITDMDGRYGFLVPSGEYFMTAKKTHYTFPTQRLQGNTQDTIYANLYFGGLFTTDAAVAKDIPMDSEQFDWNQFEKIRTHKLKFFHWFDPLLVWLMDISFFVGAIFMLWQIITTPSFYSVVLSVVYFVLYLLRIYRGRPVLYGVVTKSRKPLPFAIVHILRNGTTITKKVTDQYGRYIALLPSGKYQVMIEELVGEEQYRPVGTATVTARNGVLNKTCSF